MAENVVQVTDSEFESTILQSDKPALVDFWAAWCAPCRAIAPIVAEIADEYGDRVVVAKLDVDSSRDTAVKYGIQSIPTLLFFKDGALEEKILGLTDKKTIAATLDRLL